MKSWRRVFVVAAQDEGSKMPTPASAATTHHLSILNSAETDKIQGLQGIPAEDESVRHTLRESRHSNREMGRYPVKDNADSCFVALINEIH